MVISSSCCELLIQLSIFMLCFGVLLPILHLQLILLSIYNNTKIIINMEVVKMIILAIGCHPDDLEIGCFGTLIKYVQNGHKVFAVHLTNGDLGLVDGSLIGIRNEEAKRASEAIGAEAITLNFKDLVVDSNNPEMIRAMVSVIRNVNPDIIITHNPEDYMTDHMETSKLVFNASFSASVPRFDAPGKTCGVIPIYYMDTLANINFIPTEYVDISEVIDQKLNAISQHQSQLKWMFEHDNIDFLEFVRSCNRGRGCQCNVLYAEGFRPCLSYLRLRTKRLLP